MTTRRNVLLGRTTRQAQVRRSSRSRRHCATSRVQYRRILGNQSGLNSGGLLLLAGASTSSFSRLCPAGSPTPPTSGARRYSPLIGIHAIVSARSHKSPALHGEDASAPPILPPSQLSDRVRTIEIIESQCHSFILRPSSSRIASFPTEYRA
ncbi:hypothetical protein C8Q73DRAFT_224340 [Cubamyces lactineus]|nr:hypothetical protein C8Q73DRAFT_224340 [Cubamyces lactineus]